MSNDPPLQRLHPEDLAELMRGIRESVAPRDHKGYVADGRDAVMFREVANTLVEEKLRHKGFASEARIREISKEEAVRCIGEQLRPIDALIAKFLPEERVRAVAREEMTSIGLRADDEDHRFETRQQMMAVFAREKNRASLGKEFTRELVKALATWTFGIGTAVLAYFGLKGGNH